MAIGENGGDFTLARNANGAITVDSLPCGNATVTNTDSIHVSKGSGAANAELSLAGGPFAPGVTNEPGDSDEIEISFDSDVPGPSITGSAGADQIQASAEGVDLNAFEADSKDVDLTSAPVASIHGGNGDDFLSGGGGRYDGSSAGALTLYGDDGNDELRDSGGADTLDGGSGDDTIYDGEGSDHLDGGAGTDTAVLDDFKVQDADLRTEEATDVDASGREPLTGFENVTNQEGGRVTGDAGPNVLHGAIVSGEAGDDTLSGILDYGDSPTGVNVHQADWYSNKVDDGWGGTDTVSGCMIWGSPHDDSLYPTWSNNCTFKGGAGNDVLHGTSQGDQLDGGPGADTIDGVNGGDVIVGGPGPDTIAAQNTWDSWPLRLDYRETDHGVDLDLGVGRPPTTASDRSTRSAGTSRTSSQRPR